MDIKKINRVDNNRKDVVLHVPGHLITLHKNKKTERITRGQRVILLYSDADKRLTACICGWRAYFLNDPVRVNAHQTDVKPNANQFAGIRKNSFDKALYCLFALPQKKPGPRR